MTWESVISGSLRGISNFITSFISIIGGSINPQATEGLIAVFAVVIIYRIAQGGIRIPKSKISKRKDEDDEDEWEYIRVRRS